MDHTLGSGQSILGRTPTGVLSTRTIIQHRKAFEPPIRLPRRGQSTPNPVFFELKEADSGHGVGRGLKADDECPSRHEGSFKPPLHDSPKAHSVHSRLAFTSRPFLPRPDFGRHFYTSHAHRGCAVCGPPFNGTQSFPGSLMARTGVFPASQTLAQGWGGGVNDRSLALSR